MDGERTVSYGKLAEPTTSPGVMQDPSTQLGWVLAVLATVREGGRPVLADPAWSPAEREEAVAHVAQVDPTGADAGVWLFTSGTTAHPKPRFRSADAIAAMLEKLRARLPGHVAASRPSGLCVVPLHHGFGLLNALLLVHFLGGTVHVGPSNDWAAASRLIEEYGIKVLYAWPRHFAALADHGTWQGASPLEWCVSSSSPLVPEVAKRFEAHTGCPLRQQYGTTETGPLTVDDADPPDPRSVGTPLEGVDIVVDEHGRVAVRPAPWFSSQVPLAEDGLYYPGDRGRIDSTGRLFITGRDRPFTDDRATASGH